MTTKIIHGECLEEMRKIESNSIDLVITSPPYEDVAGAGYGAKTKDILFLKLYSEFMDGVFEELYRIIKPTGQIFFNIKHKTHNKTLSTTHWLEFLESFRKFKLKSYIIWKYAGSFDSTKSRFHLDYEIIYHLSKGDDIHLNMDCGIKDPLSSIWYVPHNIKKDERVHPTQMPEALVERILKVSSKKGDVVLDCFAGAGTTSIVSERFGLDSIAIEIKPENIELIKRRISQLVC
jgi:site-specific DNA-methyltransferase (adenine-specific)